MMKLVALILCTLFVIALVTSQDPLEGSKQRLKKIVNECRESFPVDEKARIICISKREHWQNEDGSVNKDIIRGRAEALFTDPKKREEVFNDCTKEKDTPEGTAAQIIACYKKHVNIDIDKFWNWNFL